jgi:hypothetical protein
MNYNKVIIPVFLVFVSMMCVSCLPLIFGGTAAGTTYSIVAGTVKDKLDVPKDRVVEAFIRVVEDEKGEILSASLTDGKVRARFNGKIAYLRAKKITDKSTEISLQARLEFEVVPDNDFAQYLYRKLIDKL